MFLSDLLFPPHSVGTDASESPPVELTLITGGSVTIPGALFVQNQSAMDLQVILGYGLTSPSIYLLHGTDTNLPGDYFPTPPWFVGPFAVLGTGTPQYACRFA